MARDSEFSISVTPEACVSAALMLILIPLPWLLAWFFAAALHELFHCLAVYLSGRRVLGIQIGMDGARIRTGALTELETLLCAIAGPAGGLLLIFTASMFPKLAVCAFLQSAFNLLPIYPLDGGRALHSLAKLMFSEKAANKLCLAVEVLFLAGLLLFGVFGAVVWNLGVLPIIFAGLLAVRVKKIKIPCK